MPLAWLGLGSSLGLFWGASDDLPIAGLLLLATALAGVYALARHASLPLGGIALLGAGLLLGAIRVGPDVLEDQGSLAQYHGRTVEISGTVDGAAEPVGQIIRFRIVASEVEGDTATGMAIVWASASIAPVVERDFPYLAHGDQITITGDIGAPSVIGSFDYPEHLAARGIGSVISRGSVANLEPASGIDVMRWVHEARVSLASATERHVAEPQAALVNALVLGLRGGLPPDLNDAFRRAGLSHILAVSGLHVGVLLALAMGVSAWAIGRHRLAYLAPPVLLLWLYVLLVGAPPSAVRAGIMGTAYLLALGTGRASAPVNALGLAALLVLAIDPATIWDRSFQLSFTAMAGVLLIGLPLASKVIHATSGLAAYQREAGRLVLAPVAVSAGAVAGSLPLVAFNFGQVPLLSIPATLVAMPFVPLLMVSGILTAVAGWLFASLGAVAGLASTLLEQAVVAVAEVFSSIPGATYTTEVSAETVWSSYGLLGGLVAVALRRRWWPIFLRVATVTWTGPATRTATVLLVAGLAVAAATPWAVLAWNNPTDGYLRLYFLDVGQGDATLIVTPGGGTVLIDGGPDPRVTISAIDEVLPPSASKLDLVVLTHPDADHANGVLELARRGRVQQLLAPPTVDPGDNEWQTELRATGTPFATATKGLRVTFEDGFSLEVLHPPDPPLQGTGADINNNSVALVAAWNDASALFTGDLHANGESALIRSGAELDVDVLQVGHHGSRTSTSVVFLEETSPQVAVISAGADNPFGHPANEVTDRLSASVGPWLFLTAEHGTVELASDGQRWFSSAIVEIP